MKRKFLTGVLAAVLAFTAIPTESVVVQAAEIDGYKLQAEAVNQDYGEEISVGDQVFAYGSLIDTAGQEVATDKWKFVTDDWFIDFDMKVNYYSDYDNLEQAEKNMVAFDGVVPEEAFGKFIYKNAGAYLDSEPSTAVVNYSPSRYRVTKWDNSKTYTVDCYQDNTIRVFTIKNSKKSGKKVTFPSKMKINGKSYKLDAIGDYAIENETGTGIVAVTLPSTITSIGKESFKNAKNLKNITIKGNVKYVGENAFQGINKKAVFKIKATKANYKKIVSRIKKSGAPKTVTYKRIK